VHGRSAHWRIATALFFAAGASAAHDFWIVPGTFRPEVGASVPLTLRVGDYFRGEPVLLSRTSFERFSALGPDGVRQVSAKLGSDPAGALRIEAPGLWIVGYRSRPSRVTLAAEPFEKYLTDEGLDGVLEQRAARGETTTQAQEIFSRCAKSLLLAGSAAKENDRPLGLTLELIAEMNPYVLRPGEDLSVRLLYEGDPLPGALVVAIRRDAPSGRATARTDATGRALLRLSQPGVWLVKSVHMVRARPADGADWESFWASVTFELPSR
jgi:uncharacterized GH25 family protein